jgi:uncharacterized protein YtpQ (UPF0354 family)
MIKTSLLYLLLASFLSFGLSNPAVQDTLSPTAFTEAYLKILKQKKPLIAVETPGALHVRSTVDGKTYNTFLDNVYKEYRAAVKDREKILAQGVKTALAIYSAGITVDINRIVPVIRDIGFLKDSAKIAVDSTLDTDNLPVVFDRYNEQLIVLYGQDVRTHIGYFGPSEYHRTYMERTDLREIAVNNLTGFLPDIKTLEDNGVFMVNAGGRYGTSLILCRKFWSKKQFPVNGEMVVALPSQEIILVTGNNDKKGIVKISGMAKKLHAESPCPLRTDLFVLDSSSGVFRKWSPVTESRRGKSVLTPSVKVVKKAP